MRIAYCTTLRLPSERAYGRQVAAVCQALVRLGHAVEIVGPQRQNEVEDDFWSYYGVDPSIRLTQLPAFDGIASRWTPGVIGLHLHTRSFGRQLRPYLSHADVDLLYSRNPVLLPLLVGSGKPVIIELHTLPRFGRRRFVRRCNRCSLVVCLTTPMKEELHRWGVHQDRLMVAGDAVDLDAFHQLPDRLAARAYWTIPTDAFVVGYAGSIRTMGHDKGVDQLVSATDQLRQNTRLHLLIAGGPRAAAASLQEQAARAGLGDRVHILGPVTHRDVLQLYAASDLLVYTAPASNAAYFRRDTSPLKLFEYMAAGVPMIAAALPPLRDVLDESTALLYEPGNANHLASQIAYAMDHGEDMRRMAERSKARVAEHTWTKRIERILMRSQKPELGSQYVSPSAL